MIKIELVYHNLRIILISLCIVDFKNLLNTLLHYVKALTFYIVKSTKIFFLYSFMFIKTYCVIKIQT